MRLLIERQKKQRRIASVVSNGIRQRERGGRVIEREQECVPRTGKLRELLADKVRRGREVRRFRDDRQQFSNEFAARWDGGGSRRHVTH
jgi:hypothetical protein